MASAPLTANRYAYALGNPLRYTDPSGHFVNEFLRAPGLYLSIGLQFIPGIGDAYSAATGFFGHDWIAGIQLSGTDRALALAGGLALGGGFHLLGHVDDIARAENRVGGAAGVGRSAGELRGAGRSGDSASGAGRAVDPGPPGRGAAHGAPIEDATAGGASANRNGSGPRKVVIGEDMDAREIPEARRIDADFYDPPHFAAVTADGPQPTVDQRADG